MDRNDRKYMATETNIQISPIPGAPGYFVDVQNAVCYKMRYGKLHEMNLRTKYKVTTLRIDGKTVGSTLYRMMYCAINGIDITKIPSDVCISMDGGKLVVQDRAQVVERTNKSREKAHPSMERLRKNMELLGQFYAGNVEPLLTYIAKVEKNVVWHFIWVRGISRERSELIVANAVNKYLDKLHGGHPSVYIKTSIMKYSRGENQRLAKQCDITKFHTL